MYSTAKTRSQTDCVDKKRYLNIMSKIPKKGQVLKKRKSFDPITLTAGLDALTQKTRRVNYITHLKINSHKRKIPYWDPCLHSWTVDDEKLVPVWFEGNRVPDELYHMDEDEMEDEEDEDENNEESNDGEGDSDSDSDSDSDDEEY